MQHLSSDVGGTFVDLVLFDSGTGRILVDKVSSTRHSAEGILGGVQRIADRAGLAPAEIGRFVHGFTIATNLWLTRRGGPVLFITTAGFRDVLEIGNQRRPKTYALRQSRPDPLVPRSAALEVRERVDSFGEVVEPLTDAEIARITAVARAAQPASVAICLLFSYLNPTHERRLAEALATALPATKIYASCDINPQIEEYVRANTTAAAAYVGPAVDGYVRSLQQGLDRIGLRSLLLMRSDGGVATPEAMRRNPATMLLSGPAGGVIAAAALGRTIGVEDLVGFDMGGTSADFSLIVGGAPRTSNEREVNHQPLRLPMLDIETISAGGGSIATVDHAGALHVGPQSSGSMPGPACYGKGGTQPTLTDATLALGMIDPADFAGGDLPLDPAAAEAAIRDAVAVPLGLGVDQAALGMVAVANAQMRQAIRALTIERGHDIRQFSLVAFGGAGPIFAALMARELGIRQVIVPPRPGVFAALGLLMSNMRHNAQASHLAALDAIATEVVSARLRALARDLDAALAADGIPPGRRTIRYFADLRYVGQFHDLTIPLSAPDGPDWWQAKELEALFHATHAQVYGHNDPEGAIEMVTLRCTAEGEVERASFPRLPPGRGTAPRSSGTRPVLFPGQSARLPCSAHRREDLFPGDVVRGPAIISQSDTTVLVLPDQCGIVDDWGVIRIRQEESAS